MAQGTIGTDVSPSLRLDRRAAERARLPVEVDLVARALVDVPAQESGSIAWLGGGAGGAFAAAGCSSAAVRVSGFSGGSSAAGHECNRRQDA